MRTISPRTRCASSFWIAALLFLGGCAAMPPAQIGQMAGTIAGAALAPGVGASVGGLVGMLAGMAIQGQMDKATEGQERKTLSNQLGTGPSSSAQAPAAPPQGAPTRVWVDETVQGGKLIAGHFETRYLL